MPQQADLLRALAARGAKPPPAVEWHETIGSTNDRLKELARQGAPEWTVVIADRQSGGRGREGRRWVSPSGGLYLSVLLRPRFRGTGLIPLAAGVAVAEAVAEQGVAVALKWPNDVVVVEPDAGASDAAEAGERKLAGILAEASPGSQRTDWVVLGVGINVDLEVGTLGKELSGRAASLGELAPGGRVTIAEVAAAVLVRLRVWYDALGSSPESVTSAWRARAVRWWGERIEIRVAGERLRGRLVGVDESGALLVDREGGTRRFVAGEVALLRREG